MADPTEPPLEVLLHVGLHKTGTTWLQRRFFDERSIGFRLPLHRGRDVKAALITPFPLDFDPAAAAARLIPLLREGGDGTLPVISDERLSGNPHAGAYDRKEIAERLRAVFPGARVLVVIREQRSMIRSTYKQYVRMGGPNALDEYLHWYRSGRRLRAPRGRPHPLGVRRLTPASSAASRSILSTIPPAPRAASPTRNAATARPPASPTAAPDPASSPSDALHDSAISGAPTATKGTPKSSVS